MAKQALGIDIGGVDDIDPTLNFVDEKTAVAQSVMTTLLHDPGVLWWAPSVGDDIRKYLHRPFDKDSIERSIIRQGQSDERVESVSVEASERVVGTQRVFQFDGSLTLTKNAGNVDFTIAISEAGEILNASVN
jgi:hypothetical protein